MAERGRLLLCGCAGCKIMVFGNAAQIKKV